MTNPPDKIIAAVDLGSNSFHLVVANVSNDEIQIIAKHREKVRLNRGLDENGCISAQATERALHCLEQFRQRIESLDKDSVYAVGTYTLRKAKNARQFIKKAERALGATIEIVAGKEEARLVYSGVAHQHHVKGQRLVIDIGGGSTELIIGKDFDVKLADSLSMGSSSYTRAFFSKSSIDKQSFSEALIAAELELLALEERYLECNWESCQGSSGSVHAIEKAVRAIGYEDGFITEPRLIEIYRAMIDLGETAKLGEIGVGKDRRESFPAAVAILLAIFQHLGIKELSYTPGALREGLIYELVDRSKHADARELTVQAMSARYHIDNEQAKRVRKTARHCYKQVRKSWSIDDKLYGNWLDWAVELHEVGMSISYSRYQKHGAYIIGESDMIGFGNQEKTILATLVACHRRKLNLTLFEKIRESEAYQVFYLTIILRLAVLLHHQRSRRKLPELTLDGDRESLTLTFPDDYLDRHPLISADLTREAKYLGSAGFSLVFE